MTQLKSANVSTSGRVNSPHFTGSAETLKNHGDGGGGGGGIERGRIENFR